MRYGPGRDEDVHASKSRSRTLPRLETTFRETFQDNYRRTDQSAQSLFRAIFIDKHPVYALPPGCLCTVPGVTEQHHTGA